MTSLDYTRYHNRLEIYRQRHNNNAIRYAHSSKKEIDEQKNEISILYKRWLDSKKNGSKNKTGYSKNRKIIVKSSNKKSNNPYNEKFPTCNIQDKTDEIKMSDTCLEMQYDDDFWNEISKNRDIPEDILEQLDENETAPLSCSLVNKTFEIDNKPTNKINNTTPTSKQGTKILQFENISSPNIILPTYDNFLKNKGDVDDYNKLNMQSNYMQGQRSTMNIHCKQHTNINEYLIDIDGLYNNNQVRKIYNESNIWSQNNDNLRSPLFSNLQYNQVNMMNQMNVYGRTMRFDMGCWPSKQFNQHSTYHVLQDTQENQDNLTTDIQPQINSNYLNLNYYAQHSKPIDLNLYVDNSQIIRNANNLHAQTNGQCLPNIHLQTNNSQINSQLTNWNIYDKVSY